MLPWIPIDLEISWVLQRTPLCLAFSVHISRQSVRAICWGVFPCIQKCFWLFYVLCIFEWDSYSFHCKVFLCTIYIWLVLEQPLNTVLFNFASRTALLCAVCCFWYPAHNQKCLNINANHHFVVFITVTSCELCRQCNRLGFREPGPLSQICRDFICWYIRMVSPWLRSSFFNEK